MSDENRTIVLAPDRFSALETGARLFAILAFPGPHEEKEYEAAAEAYCADLLHKAVGENPEDADYWSAVYPRYFAITDRDCRRRLRTSERRLRDRMLASRMALGFFQEGHSGKPVRLPESMKRHSLNELARLVQGQSTESDPENLEKRAWRQSLPVVHLAAAMQVAARAMAPDKLAVPYDLSNEALHEQVIALAQVHEEIVLSDPRFGKNRANIIRIRRHPGPAN
jgi:hypothetical protein